MAKVSFDFDYTLTKLWVQRFFRECLENDHEVWIVTARSPDETAPSKTWNIDIWQFVDRVGLPRERVVFMSLTPKWKFFEENPDFAFHIDDFDEEVDEINKHTTVRAINHIANAQWQQEAKQLLETVK